MQQSVKNSRGGQRGTQKLHGGEKITKEVYTNDLPEFYEFEYPDNVGGEDEVQEINHKKRGGGSFPSGSNKKLSTLKGPMDIFLWKCRTLMQTNIKTCVIKKQEQ